MLPPRAPGCQWTQLPRIGRYDKEKARNDAGLWTFLDVAEFTVGGRCWDRTSDLSRVKGALYH
jgi:hypothetical protein